MTKIIHYCNTSYETGSVGGVARFDDHIKRAFPHRIFISPGNKKKMLDFLKHNSETIVITDNGLACDIPKPIKTIIFHHGCGETTWERNFKNNSDENFFFNAFVKPQRNMLSYRSPRNTIIASISTACTEDFTKYYGINYTKFLRCNLFHTSEFDESIYKTSFNENPVVLGNWLNKKKGDFLIPKLKDNIPNFYFKQLDVKPIDLSKKELDKFIIKKQEIYNSADIFLQISNSEGNSYATLDALICGLPVVASNVGLFYKDVPEDCFVKMEWEKNNDVDYVREKLIYAWENKEKLSQNARNWYMTNYRYVDWLRKIKSLIQMVQNH
jgi:glycosyltransferase involved in cell wall biosynthesis